MAVAELCPSVADLAPSRKYPLSFATASCASSTTPILVVVLRQEHRSRHVRPITAANYRPTPYFYDAIHQHQHHRSIMSLRDFELGCLGSVSCAGKGTWFTVEPNSTRLHPSPSAARSSRCRKTHYHHSPSVALQCADLIHHHGCRP